MKYLKYIPFVLGLLMLSCDEDDNEEVQQIIEERLPIDILSSISVDIDDIVALPIGSDITNLVDFGQPAGVSAADYTVELEVDDTFTLSPPSGLGTGDSFLYSAFFFLDENGDPFDETQFLSSDFPEDTQFIADPEDPDFEVFDRIRFTAIDAEDENDRLLKYDIEIFIFRETTNEFIGPYFVDPKIQIKSRRRN